MNPLIHTYNPKPVTFVKGEGCYLYDEEGEAYLDFASGIAVNALGHGHPSMKNNIMKQMESGLIHCSNLYAHGKDKVIADKINKLSSLKGCFFTNSGTEGVEGALKMARIYGHMKHNRGGHIISMDNSFHGRSYGALSLTGQKKYHNMTWPLLSKITHVPYNDYMALAEAVTKDTCAIIIEPIQGEGGVIPLEPSYIKKVAALCEEKDILLICDEVQTGVGRTGSWFAYEHYDITPDILVLAKGLGGGFPVGCIAVSQKVKDCIQPGMHASTFGGNPLAMSAVDAVLTTIEEENLIENVKSLGISLFDKLKTLQERYPQITHVRGKGFLAGVQLENRDVILEKMFEKKCLLVPAGKDVLRFLPPLIATEEDIQMSIYTFQQVLKEVYDES